MKLVTVSVVLRSNSTSKFLPIVNRMSGGVNGSILRHPVSLHGAL